MTLRIYSFILFVCLNSKNLTLINCMKETSKFSFFFILDTGKLIGISFGIAGATVVFLAVFTVLGLGIYRYYWLHPMRSLGAL